MSQWRLGFRGIGDSLMEIPIGVSTSGDADLLQFSLGETQIGVSTSGIADSPGPKKILQNH